MKKFILLAFTVLVAISMSLSCSKEDNGAESIDDYLCFTASLDNSRIGVMASEKMATMPVLEYSLDGKKWERLYIGVTTVTLSRDESVYFRGNNASFSYAEGQELKFVYFTMEGMFYASGKLMSLLDKECKKTTIPNEYCFAYLFKDCKGLIDPPVLTATKLTKACYDGLFYGCVNLETAPELPVTELAEGCYAEMFFGCTKLTDAPRLPATKLVSGCYYKMFGECMNLQSISVSFTEWAPKDATFEWVDKVGDSGVFNCPRELGQLWDKSHIPENFEVKN